MLVILNTLALRASLLKLRFAPLLFTLASLALFATRIFYILHISLALNVFAEYR